MDEQLEQPIERREAEAQSEEAVLSPAGEEAAKEAAERTDNPEAEINTESSAEEKVTPDAELSASEEKDNPDGDDSCPPCLKGVANSGATGVNDLPVAGQSRGVTEPQREGSEADRGIQRRRNEQREYLALSEA